MIYRPADELTFGKNNGFTLAEVWQYQPTYIVWLILHVKTFCVDIESFRKLPKPTPFSTGAVSGSEEMKNLKGANIILKGDGNNPRLTVDMIIKGQKAGVFRLNESNYWFSDEVIEKNNIKIKENALKDLKDYPF